MSEFPIPLALTVKRLLCHLVKGIDLKTGKQAACCPGTWGELLGVGCPTPVPLTGVRATPEHRSKGQGVPGGCGKAGIYLTFLN